MCILDDNCLILHYLKSGPASQKLVIMYKVASKYGIGIAIVLIVYFLILKLVGLHHYPAFSVVNGLIYGVGLYLAIQNYKHSLGEIEYGHGFATGMAAGGIATVIFTVFIAIYAFQIDTEFASEIIRNWDMGYELGTSAIVISAFVMGFATTLVLTLAFMQRFKKSWNIGRVRREQNSHKL